MQVDSVLAPNASYHVPIIVDKKCPQFIVTMALGSAMLIPISNLTDPSKQTHHFQLPFFLLLFLTAHA